MKSEFFLNVLHKQSSLYVFRINAVFLEQVKKQHYHYELRNQVQETKIYAFNLK